MKNMIKELRKKLNLTQSDLAKLLGCTVTTISNWETGKFKPAKYYEKQIIELNKESN